MEVELLVEVDVDDVDDDEVELAVDVVVLLVVLVVVDVLVLVLELELAVVLLLVPLVPLVDDALDVVVVVLVLEELLVLVLVDDEVVDTDVVPEDVSVDVCVVDGDVTSQLKKLPSLSAWISSLKAPPARAWRVAPPRRPVSLGMSSVRYQPSRSYVRAHPMVNSTPPLLPKSCCVTSRSSAPRPVAVLARQAVLSKLTRSTNTCRASAPVVYLGSSSRPHSSLVTLCRAMQSSRPVTVFSMLTACLHSYTWALCTKISAKSTSPSK